MRWLAMAFGGVLAMATATGGEAGKGATRPAKLWQVRDGLPNVLAKLAGGGEVTIAYFGGSITAAPGWRPKTLAWFRERWPGATVRQVHAAIGGTGSDLGVFRCQKDVLAGEPDLVFVEFAVNDGGAPPERIHKTIEGIVRQVWTADPTTDICFVYTLHEAMLEAYQAGRYPRSAAAMERVADHYGIPSICMALRVARLHEKGRLVFTLPRGEEPPEGKLVFAHDACHPTEAGHALFAEVIAQAILAMEGASEPGPHELEEPFDPDNWHDARLVDIQPAMLSGRWQKLDKTQGLGKRFAARLPTIWHTDTPGSKLAFRFKGTLCRIYDLVGPDGGIALCTVDGREVGERPRFDGYCTYWRLQTFAVAEGLDAAEHAATIELSPRQPDREPVLERVRGEKGFDPRKYDGTNLWLGYILLRGELLAK
ncbi:MAG: GDSL-type esterase/lipase family protein [bacterium]